MSEEPPSAVSTGDVVLLYDGSIRRQKHKRWVCVCVSAGWFLRINSEPKFQPHLPIKASDNPNCLEHDSYIELRGILDHDMDQLAGDLRAGDARVLGSIGAATAARLRQAVLEAKTLTPAEKKIIETALASPFAGITS